MRSHFLLVFIIAIIVCSVGTVSGQQRMDQIETDPFTKVMVFVERGFNERSRIGIDGAQTFTISGRAMLANGQPIYNAKIQLTDFTTFNRSVITSPLGYFTLSNIPAGDFYALSVSHKLFLFSAPTQLIEVKGDISGLIMLAELP